MSQQAAAAPRVYAVGEVVSGVRRLLEDRVGRLWVAGELRDVKRPRSGHVYFQLADDVGQLRAALFRADARRVAFEPEDGLAVLAYGDLTVYEPRGDLQLVVRALEPRGVGALQVAFEQLRRRLEAEGVFDPARKRRLPALPARIGVVTSPSGAALRDVIEVTGRRLPSVPLLLAPTRVQGPGADREVAAAIDALSGHGGVSVVLLVRGGGSLEDLQAFNSEAVARAIRACRVPVIAGVGHEVDVTIADLAADVRAPTPSAAAELALPDRRALAGELRGSFTALAAAARDRLDTARVRIERLDRAVAARSPQARLALQRERLRASARALVAAARDGSAGHRRRLGESAARLQALSPLAVLGRGYALVRRARDLAIVRAASDVAVGDELAIRVERALIGARIETLRETPSD
jgi:exodeoxyribonuclease VII large subunit